MLHIHVPLFHLLSCNSLLHPQVKLEHSRIVPIIPWSIPAGRGKVLSALRVGQHGRITPAWAGKSLSRPPAGGLGWDHPRVGGEKVFLIVMVSKTRGSPPRGRGKALAENALRQHFRITPAWAGKRLKRSHRSGIFISGPIPFHSVLHRPAGSGGSRAGRDGSPAGQPQNTGPA